MKRRRASQKKPIYIDSDSDADFDVDVDVDVDFGDDIESDEDSDFEVGSSSEKIEKEEKKDKGKGKGKGKATKYVKGSKASVMKSVELLQKSMLESVRQDIPTLSELDIQGVRKEVSEMPEERVMDRIEATAFAVASSILKGHGFALAVPTRSSTNQVFVPELDRIVMKDKVSLRSFGSVQTIRKTVIMLRVIQLVYELCKKGIHATKRDLFYTDVKLFGDQTQSDILIEDTAAMLGCTRPSLNIVASEKGVIIGRIQFREAGDEIDCSRMGIGGKAIPGLVDRITDIRSDAKFVLLVEKDAAFMRLAEDRFYQQYPCIIITGKGEPDVATRMLLRRIRNELRIPILGLFDSDPHGLKIMSVYMFGSKSMSYSSHTLTTPDIKWLGVRPSDLNRYDIPQQCRLPMKPEDLKTGKDLLNEDFIQSNEEWCKELRLMLSMKVKAEIQALSSHGFQYLTESYLPRKLQSGDWI